MGDGTSPFLGVSQKVAVSNLFKRDLVFVLRREAAWRPRVGSDVESESSVLL